MASFRKLKSGWRAEVFVDGHRASKVHSTKQAAKLWASEAERRLRGEGAPADGRMTLRDVFRRYGDEVSGEKRGSRWELLRLRLLGEFALADVRLKDLRREHIEAWIKERSKTVKPSTVNRELNLISHCLAMARRWRLMVSNPMEGIQRPKDPPPRDRLVSDWERDAILVALGYIEGEPVITQQQRVAVAFLLAMETAMRAGELCALTAQSTYLEERKAYLAQTKNGAPRWVPLSTRAVELLEKLAPWPDEGPLMRMRSGNLSTVFKKAVGRAGIENLTFHDTRHEAITRMAAKVDMLALARIVGHKNPKQLLTYYNAKPEDLAKLLG